MDVATQWMLDQIAAELTDHLTEVRKRTTRMGALKAARTMLAIGYSLPEVRAFLAAHSRAPGPVPE